METLDKIKLRNSGYKFAKKFFTTQNIILDKYKTKDKSYLTNLTIESGKTRLKSFFKSRSLSNTQLKQKLEDHFILELKDLRRLTVIEHCSHYVNYIETPTIKLVLIWDLEKVKSNSIFTKMLLPKNTFKSDLELVEKDVILIPIANCSFAFTMIGGNYKVFSKKELIQTIQQL
jgi:hypothetical protein